MSTFPAFSLWEYYFRGQIKRRRELLNLSQSELARRLKARGLPFHAQTVQRVETGERPVRLGEAFIIADVLDATFKSMLEDPTSRLMNLSYAIDQFRAITERLTENLQEDVGGWLDAVDSLALTVDALFEASKGTPTREVRYSAAWAMKAKWLYHDIAELVETSGLTRDKRPHDTWMPEDHTPTWVLDSDTWDSVPMDERPESLARLEPNELQAYLNAEVVVADVEHPEAF